MESPPSPSTDDIDDLLARAEDYRRRACTARTADIQQALLQLAGMYEEMAESRRRPSGQILGVG